MAEALRAEGLSKNFGGLMAVNQVNFHVLEGQTAGIIGPNGSGKTTLFNLLSGHIPPSKGRIHFKGREVTATLPHLRVMMGMARTFQLVSVFHSLTVWENLVLSSIRFKQAEHTLGNFFFRPAQKKKFPRVCSA